MASAHMPTRLMELANEIELEDNQQKAINDISERMRTRVIKAGERFIEAEASLEAAFQSGQLSPERLREHLDTIANDAASCWDTTPHLPVTTYLTATIPPTSAWQHEISRRDELYLSPRL